MTPYLLMLRSEKLSSGVRTPSSAYTLGWRSLWTVTSSSCSAVAPDLHSYATLIMAVFSHVELLKSLITDPPSGFGCNFGAETPTGNEHVCLPLRLFRVSLRFS